MPIPLIIAGVVEGAIVAYRGYKVAKAAYTAYKAYKLAKKAQQVANAVKKAKQAADAAVKAANAAKKAQKAANAFSKTTKGCKQGCPKAAQARAKAAQASKGAKSSKRAQVRKNARDGSRREREQHAELQKKYPDAKVQRERLLRDASGKVVKDPVTGTARRLDHVVIKDGKVVEIVETTSPAVNKSAQLAKEVRIIRSGGNFIRDAQTKELIPIGNQASRVVPRP